MKTIIFIFVVWRNDASNYDQSQTQLDQFFENLNITILIFF